MAGSNPTVIPSILSSEPYAQPPQAHPLGLPLRTHPPKAPHQSSKTTTKQVRLLSPERESAAGRAQVTSILLSPDGSTVAAGYSSGLVLLFSLKTGATAVTLHGHRSAVTAARYHASGALLASGSADTDIVVWDAVAESGLYRLRGHRDGVTDVVFLGGGGGVVSGGCRLRNGLASCSKDTLVKLWDLDTQSCVQTVVGHRGEVRRKLYPRTRFVFVYKGFRFVNDVGRLSRETD